MGVSAPVGPALGQAPEEWRPSPSSLKKMGPEATLLGYRFFTPKGHQSVPPKGEAEELKLSVWGLPKRPDALSTTLVVIVFVMPEGVAKSKDKRGRRDWIDRYNSGAYKSYMEGNGKLLGLEDLRVGEKEAGTIDQIPFTRVHWTANSSRAGKKLHGFYYVGQDDGKIITINSYDSDEAVVDSREAATLTFRRK
jgi:hypothetical protein